jgi:hypothetical protein
VRRSRFGHSEVATTHRGGDKPGRIQRLDGLDDPDSTTRTRRRRRNVHVGAIDHGDHGDHCLQPVGGLHPAPEEKPVSLFHEEESGRCCLFLAVTVVLLACTCASTCASTCIFHLTMFLIGIGYNINNFFVILAASIHI